MRKVLLECVSEDDLREIIAEVIEQAKEGDLGAAKLVLSYVVGKPVATVDPDRVDVEEFHLLQEETCSGAQFSNVLNGVPAGLACEVLEAVVPVQSLAQRQQFVEELLAEDEEEDLDEDEEEDAPETDHATPPAHLPSVEEIIAYQRLVAAAMNASANPSSVAHSTPTTDTKRAKATGTDVDGGRSGAANRVHAGTAGGSRPDGAMNGTAEECTTKKASEAAPGPCLCGQRGSPGEAP
jgi:hypothetical protein